MKAVSFLVMLVASVSFCLESGWKIWMIPVSWKISPMGFLSEIQGNSLVMT